ncbi:Hsp70 family protein [Polymorphospora sp. NPDC051019]|uniref:Hsp70 family protein n=1 Tax=Polymorphospora sp. NPDC051019 TaxID=3155725 RepID=UPI003428F344
MPANPAPPSGHALGVDFGTSHTVAVVRWPDGRARPLLVDGSPLLPSAVYAEPGGGISVGRDAVHSARLDPSRFEPNPKRRIDEGTVLLGDREVPVVDLMAAVLGRVAEEWRRTVGQVTPRLTLTCPATWGATRRGQLADAAGRAGLGQARLVAEPVAAATYFAEVLGRDVPIGSVVVVHDFGAGTFDASVVARRATGFEVLAVDGCDDVGGLDIDAALLAHLRTTYADRGSREWERLANPSTVEERRAKRQLWDDVRVAKERLSRRPAADLVIPLLDLEVHLTREELEGLARPLLEQTIRVTRGVMGRANLADGQVAGVFLVGGSSRIPLLATMLHRALGTAPVVIEQPELVVAEGSVLAGTALLASRPSGAEPPPPPIPGPLSPPPIPGPAVPVSGPPVPAPPVSGSPVPAPPVSGSPVPAPPVFGPPAGHPAPTSGAPVSGSPVSGAPVSGPPVPVSPVAGQPPRTVGRVIVPDAVPPPGRPATGPAGPPVAPTRQLPRVPGQPPVAPPSAGPGRIDPTRIEPVPPPAGPLPSPPRPASRTAPTRLDPDPPRFAAEPPRPAGVPLRPVSPPPRQVSVPRPVSPPAPPPAYPPAPARRRPGPVRRTLRTLFVLTVLVGTPVLAGVIAFRVGEGESFGEVVTDLLGRIGISLR